MLMGVGLGCAQIAGLGDGTDDSTSGGTSGTSGGTSGTAAAGAGDYSLTPESLDLGTLDCGAEGKTPLTIINSGKYPLDYKLESVNPVFTISAPKGSVPANDKITVSIAGKPTKLADVTADLLLTVNGNTPRKISAKVSGRGAMIELPKPVVDFGDVRWQSGSETVDVPVKNIGNAPLDVVGMTPSGTSTQFLLSPNTLSAPAGQTGTLKASMQKGTAPSATATTAKYVPQVRGAICGEIPTLELRGKLVATDVTLGSVDFGDTACKSSPTDKSATVSNYASTAVGFTVTAPSAPFTIASPLSDSVPGSPDNGTTPGTKAIKVHVDPGTSPGDKNATLKITVGAQGDRTAPLHTLVYGAVLTITPASQTFASDGGAVPDQKTFNIANVGNDVLSNASYTTPSSAGGFTATGPSMLWYPNLFGGDKGTVTVRFTAGAASSNGTLVVTSSNSPICSQTTPVTLTGTKL